MTPLVIASLALAQSPPANIDDVIQKNFKDASFTLRVLRANQKELAKINKDFGTHYRFEKTDVRVKEPFKMRLSASVEDSNVVLIINGYHRLFSVPRVRIVNRENLKDEPGKRQTALDYGMITPGLFDDLFIPKFVRRDRATDAYVFDLTYHPHYDYDSHLRVWIDPERKFVAKKEWYRKNRHLATFYYTDPKQSNGVWMPTRVTVKNVEDKVAAESVMENLQVNTGLSDELFKVK